jgi:CSLREA domain-containing protein
MRASRQGIARHINRCAFAALVLWLGIGAARAETFTVTRFDDPDPDACTAADCSLREAMLAAEENDPLAEADEIVLAAGTYTLERGSLNQVRQPLRVQGAGSAQTHVVSDDEDASLFNIGSDGELALVGVGLDSAGGAISIINEDSSLSLDDILVEQGITTFGPGATVEMRNSELRRNLYCSGAVLIEDSTIFNLYQMEPQEATAAVTLRRTLVDGTLNPDPPTSTIAVHAGTLAIEDSMIADSALQLLGPNTTEVRGSTFTRTDVSLGAGTLTVEDSTITHSSIVVQDAATALHLRRVQYLDNAGPVRTEVAASVTIEDSLFEGNLERALFAAGGAEWSVSGSSFVDNRGDGNAGGAIVLEDDTELRISNSTFSGNSFTVDAAAGGARGAAVGFRNGTGAYLLLTHVTLVAPSFLPAGVIGSAIGGHGTGVTLDISNSIVRGTCGIAPGVLQNNTGNIESPGATCGLDLEGNLVSVDPTELALGTLGDHGGETPTYLPGEDSRAIDRASTPQCLAFDQRGYARPGGVRCDVGAVEADADDILFADGFDG